MGEAPSATRQRNSRAFCPCGTTGTSVAQPIGMPAASARLNPPSAMPRIRRRRSSSLAGITLESPWSSIALLTPMVGT